MPKVSNASAAQVEVIEGILEDHSENLDGYTTGFTTFIASGIRCERVGRPVALERRPPNPHGCVVISPKEF